MRIIDADALKEALTKACNTFEAFGIDTTIERVMISCIDNAPTIKAKPVKRGVWKEKMLDRFRKYERICSECGTKYIYDEPDEFNYCPNCGVKMGEEK